MIKSFRDLEVWRKANQLAHEVFDLTETFPRSYLFDLTSQLRRAVLSIPTNLAEGCATSHSKEPVQFVNISKRSVSEAQYLLSFAFERKLVKESQFHNINERYEEVNRMLGGLRRSLRILNGSDSNTHHSPFITRH